ncbi:hypothetical protein K6Y31_06610 [Motilimonas cestriensis]|uniref:DUF4124 domain-containing protein n=1 Tax=Motilimonas cestriensis TaxID=2742685 RepID=A0ABS8W675_9GAMM|nr:hypothetical protein [Motilimonas cestriensis]MCE2594481.1 hypothetical protein [Motilimonas cestriensis]
MAYRLSKIQHLLLLTTLLIASMLIHNTAQGAVYKCQVGGKTVYQSSTCFKGKQTVLKPTKHDTGLHASWFSRPPLLPDTAICSGDICRCGDQTLPLSADSQANVEKSLSGLINDWQQHQKLYQVYLKLPVEEQKISNQRANIADTACMIAMHQTLLNQSYLEVINPKVTAPLTEAQLNAKLAELCSQGLDDDMPLNEAEQLFNQCVADEKRDNDRLIEQQAASNNAPKFPTQVATLKLKNPYEIE